MILVKRSQEDPAGFLRPGQEGKLNNLNCVPNVKALPCTANDDRNHAKVKDRISTFTAVVTMTPQSKATNQSVTIIQQCPCNLPQTDAFSPRDARILPAYKGR